ncbi:MAG: hypothetical protein WHT08_14780 [Bryobacteraceae bacterium]|jgi:hypothetical protein
MSNIEFLLTVGLLAGTVWLAASRLRMRLDNNWPLVYYFGAVVYLNTYHLVLNSYVVYIAVVCALLLRFEFMSERLVALVRFLEVGALVHTGWRLMNALWRDLR